MTVLNKRVTHLITNKQHKILKQMYKITNMTDCDYFGTIQLLQFNRITERHSSWILSHLELNTLKIRFIVAARRVNYIYTIFQIEDKNIVLQYYKAQHSKIKYDRQIDKYLNTILLKLRCRMEPSIKANFMKFYNNEEKSVLYKIS